MWGKTKSYDVHEALYQNFEIHNPWVRALGPRVGSVWPYRKNVWNLTKSSYLLQYIFKEN